VPVWVAQLAGRVGIVAQFKARLHQQPTANEVHGLLALKQPFVRIAALPEARWIADGKSKAIIDDDLRQLTPGVGNGE